MLDGYKTSLSYVNSLTWSTLSISLLLLFLNPTDEKVNILGINFSQDSIIYIGPLVILVLLLTRRIVIGNAAYIVKSNRSNADLKKLTKFYPLLEFIRWRAASKLETILLTFFDGFISYLPTYITVLTMSKMNQSLWIKLLIAIFVGSIVAGIVQWNYLTLRMKVYEPLCGKVKTPD